MKYRLKLLGHRGYSAKYPENTLLAFNKAFENNADGIECDLQKSKDNKFVIIHDDEIDRTTDKNGKVSHLTLNEIKKSSINETEKILELSELLSVIPKNKFVNIELKKESINEDDCPEILRIALKYLKKDNLFISSFSEKLLHYFKKQGIKIGLLVDEKYRELGAFKFFKVMLKTMPDYVNLPILMFEELGVITSYIILILIKIFGRKVCFWGVNNEKDLQRVIRFSGIIITDEVEFIYNAINKI
jgi:glycerophosphoryl diester phosphodiesterase